MESNKKFTVLCLLLYFNQIFCEDVIVSPPVGKIRGSQETVYFNGQSYSISTFKGIPFAKSTAGQVRFAKPVKQEKFTGIYDATEEKPSCPQNINWAPGLDQLPVSEECLNLNIFTPANISSGDLKPVMIFIYGGGFQYGLQDAYASSSLTALHDIVYVTMNYRVGIYGFLASKKHGLKGNYGLWDQHMAIQWVHDNIAAFGGDPGNVTLFGESAGAVSVMYQALYNGNRGLIHRVIAQSGTVGSDFGFSRFPDLSFEDLCSKSNCDSGSFESKMECLRGKTVDELEGLIGFEDMYSPIQDGDFIDYDPEIGFKNMSQFKNDTLDNYAAVDVIIGINSDEGLLEIVTIAAMLEEQSSEFSNGFSEGKLNNYINKFLRNINNTNDVRVFKSLKHEYSNWNAQISDESRGRMLSTMLKDFFYTSPAVQSLLAHLNQRSHGNTYMYYFDHKPSFTKSPDWIKGADHAEELPFVFGFPGMFMFLYDIYSEDPATQLPEKEVNLSMAMMKYWSQFARTGYVFWAVIIKYKYIYH